MRSCQALSTSREVLDSSSVENTLGHLDRIGIDVG